VNNAQKNVEVVTTDCGFDEPVEIEMPMEKKAFFVRGVNVDAIRAIKVLSASNGKTIGETVNDLVDYYLENRQ
jgi:hypothetical protein